MNELECGPLDPFTVFLGGKFCFDLIVRFGYGGFFGGTGLFFKKLRLICDL